MRFEIDLTMPYKLADILSILAEFHKAFRDFNPTIHIENHDDYETQKLVVSFCLSDLK